MSKICSTFADETQTIAQQTYKQPIIYGRINHQTKTSQAVYQQV